MSGHENGYSFFLIKTPDTTFTGSNQERKKKKRRKKKEFWGNFQPQIINIINFLKNTF